VSHVPSGPRAALPFPHSSPSMVEQHHKEEGAWIPVLPLGRGMLNQEHLQGFCVTWKPSSVEFNAESWGLLITAVGLSSRHIAPFGHTHLANLSPRDTDCPPFPCPSHLLLKSRVFLKNVL
jgi:hypothetical protein